MRLPTTLAHHVVADTWVNCCRSPTSAGGEPRGFEAFVIGSADATGLDATALDAGALSTEALSTGALEVTGTRDAKTEVEWDAAVVGTPHAAVTNTNNYRADHGRTAAQHPDHLGPRTPCGFGRLRRWPDYWSRSSATTRNTVATLWPVALSG